MTTDVLPPEAVATKGCRHSDHFAGVGKMVAAVTYKDGRTKNER